MVAEVCAEHVDAAGDIYEPEPRDGHRETRQGSSRLVASRQWMQRSRELQTMWEAEEAEREAPMIEACRPIVDAAYVSFLKDPERWADVMIVVVEGGIVGAGTYQATTTKEGMWLLAEVMAFFYPDNNPYTQALQQLGGRDISCSDMVQTDGGFKVKINDPVAFSIDRILRMSDPRTKYRLRLSSYFPDGTTPEQAAAMLRQWLKRATGRDVGEPVEGNESYPAPTGSTGGLGKDAPTPTEKDCLRIYAKLGAFTEKDRATNRQVAIALHGAGAKANSVARHTSNCVKKGFTKSSGGAAGGSWLTEKGREIAEQ